MDRPLSGLLVKIGRYHDDDSSGQIVIVDEIRERTVRLRDPYHGREMTVTRSALENRLVGGEVIQIEKAVPSRS